MIMKTDEKTNKIVDPLIRLMKKINFRFTRSRAILLR